MSKIKKKISLKQAIDFHGHLGPYLVLGLLAGEIALRKLKVRKYFGLNVKVWGATEKPKSCLVDGLQLSTGATYGKGNIQRLGGNKIIISFTLLHPESLHPLGRGVTGFANVRNKLRLSFKNELIEKLKTLKGHKDSEVFARKLYNINPSELFNLTTDN